jgi:uncharacterized protein
MMQSYLKTRPAGIQFLIFLGMAVGIFMAVGLLGSWLLAEMMGINMIQLGNMEAWDYKDPKMIAFMRGMLLIQFLGLFVIPSLLYAYFADARPAQYLGLKRPFKPVYWVFALIALLIAIPFIDLMGLLNQKVNFGGNLQQWMKQMEEKATRQTLALLGSRQVSDLLKNLVFIALFAGIGEELFFRGILQRLFIQGFRNAWIGIVLAAFVFSFFHFQFFGFFPRFFLGILLGALYWYSGSLWTAMLAHFIYDAVIIILIFMNPDLARETESSLFPKSTVVVMAVASAALIGWMVWYMKKHSAAGLHQIFEPDDNRHQKFTINN